MVRALLQQRNTPDRDCQLSPAEVLFGRGLRDAMPQLSKSVQIFESDQIHNQWHEAWAAKEEAIRARLVRSCEQLEMGSRELPSLREGDHVLIQNQDKSSGRPNKWDRQGEIIASKDHDQYLVKVHGSGRLTLRNRRFLRKFNLRSQCVESQPSAIMPPFLVQEHPVLSDATSASTPIPKAPQHSEQPNEGEDQQSVIIPPVPDQELPVATPSASASMPQSPQHSEPPPPTRGAGRPPKRRNFNFMKRVPAQSQPAGADVSQYSEGIDGENWRARTPRTGRERRQRQIYDAATGGYKDPSG